MSQPISTIKKFVLPSVYLCPECSSRHNSEGDALSCCGFGIDPVYICPICGEHHVSSDGAIACCDYDPENPPLAAGWELELAGQQRLDGVS